MVIDEWRYLLYYPFGLLPSIFFTLRFLIQWLKSENAGVSYVDAGFWKLSLAGNLLLFTHYTIQGQYIFGIIQTGNALIAWRNLNLMTNKAPCSLPKTLAVFAGTIFLTCATLLFLEFVLGDKLWIRIPKNALTSVAEDPGFLWHAIGFSGQALFASRFWVQWWSCEKHRKSELGTLFWWLSILGTFFSAVYFFRIRDVVSCINQSFGIIPYLRNLMLIKKNDRAGKLAGTKSL